MEALNQDKVNYESYLKIKELLTLQQLLSPHHDEMLFILIHQIYELWFREVLHEMEEIIRCFETDDVQRAIKVFHRVHTIQKVLVTQIDVLETMTPTEFAEFRDNLRPASGFQSVQFREIEFMSGLKNLKFLELFTHLPEAKARLEKRMHAPTVYDYFLNLLKRRGFNIPEAVLKRDYSQLYVENETVTQELALIYNNATQYYELYMLCEALLNYDENFSLWRYRHVKMVERTIGMKAGTGGSSGAKYLAATLEGRFFPDIWGVRTLIGTY